MDKVYSRVLEKLSDNSSEKMVLEDIKQGDVVLECGCATGYMTRYMTEVLGATVYIIEFSEEAFRTAIQYAKDGICTDLEGLIWKNKFKNIRFDYILFADVLEHLRNPLEILQAATKLLKDDGKIRMSIPNVAHHDILINLYHNQWNYTRTGLLDDTHIHFWGYENLKELCRDAHLRPILWDYTILPAFKTEQAYHGPVHEMMPTIDQICRRPFGDVFQFIITAQKDSYVQREKIDSIDRYEERHAQYGIIPECCIAYESKQKNADEERNTLESIILNRDSHIKKLLDYNEELQKNRESYIETINELKTATSLQQQKLYDERNVYIKEKEKQQNTILQLTNELNEYKHEYLEAINCQNIFIKENKEQQNTIAGLTDELNEYKHEYLEAINHRDLLKQQVADLDLAFHTMENSTCWKMTKPIRVSLDTIKRLLKKNHGTYMICRGIKCWKENGIRYTWRRLQYKMRGNREYQEVLAQNSQMSELPQAQTEYVDGAIKFSVLVPLYNTDERFLREMIQSVIGQTYQNWELCLADGSDEAHASVQRICEEYAQTDARIRYQHLTENLGISENSNRCAEMATGDYIALLDHDDLYMPQALQMMAAAIEITDADVLYSDEDKVTESGVHANPFFKPDWSPDLLYAQMYICHLLVFKRSFMEALGGFRKEFDGSQDYDLMLRLSEVTQDICHVPMVLYSWRECQTSTAANADSKPYAWEAGRAALQSHLDRKYGGAATAQLGKYTFTFDVRYEPKQKNPKISIIIPMKDHVELTDQCVKSILRKSTYSNYEILILNNRSEEGKSFKWFKEIKKKDHRIKVIDADFEFNWSKLNNFGMKYAKGDVYIFLNNDIEVISPDWMERLSENALRDEIGVVGAQLHYEDKTIQHAGVVVGFGGFADHVFKGMDAIHYGCPFVSPVLDRNVLAVTGACMAISKKTIEEIGAFNDEFIICGSDVEICLRAHEHGLFNLYDAYTELYHLESKTRDTFIPQIDFELSNQFYGPYRDHQDPYYNLNLDLNSLRPKVREDVVNQQEVIAYLKRTKLAQKAIQKIKKASYSPTVGETQPIYAREDKLLGDQVRLNLLVPSVKKKDIFGGIATALKFFQQLAEEMDVPTRFIVTDSTAEAGDEPEHYVLVDSMQESVEKHQVISFGDRSGKTIPVGKNDVFMATGWWTAYTIFPVIDWQSSTYSIEKHPLIYLIQDYEPGFYAWSSRYLMADSTYKSESPVIAVFNSKLLHEFFANKGYRFAKEYYFEPTLNSELKKILLADQHQTKRKKQVLVYGRPSTQRNAFELVVDSLKQWCTTQENIQEWTILSAGEQHPDIDLGNGMKLHSVGKLSLEEYAKMMLETYMGVSLMVSPHPSYPPLEMATFGIHVVTNRYDNKNLSSFSKQIHSLDRCSATAVSKNLEHLASQFTEESNNYHINDAYLNNDAVFDDIVRSIKLDLA